MGVSTNKQAQKVICAKVDHDYLYDGEIISESYVGKTWEAALGVEYDNTWVLHPVPDGPKMRFRLLDDDNEVYYGGWLLNDDECINQQIILDWAMHDSGAVIIQVKVNNEWVQEIG